jgi:hypothetical protein
MVNSKQKGAGSDADAVQLHQFCQPFAVRGEKARSEERSRSMPAGYHAIVKNSSGGSKESRWGMIEIVVMVMPFLAPEAVREMAWRVRFRKRASRESTGPFRPAARNILTC